MTATIGTSRRRSRWCGCWWTGCRRAATWLLKVGPTGRGQLDSEAVRILREVGGWMALHERSVRGCGASALRLPPDCRYTQRGDRLYLHLFAWPFRRVHLPGLAARVEYAQLLHDASEVQWSADSDGMLTLHLPTVAPPVLMPVVELFLGGGRVV
jgi:alpha-L-fucosidase